MKNFKSSVPNAVQVKLMFLAQGIEAQFDNIVSAFSSRAESITDVSLNEIEGNYVSGWMPRQDGGYDVSQMFRSDLDSSYHFTEKQTDFVNDQSEDCRKAFYSDNGIDSDDELDAEQESEYCNYESDWFQDGALFQVQMFANGYPGSVWEEKEQTINIRVSVNYKDAPYFRESSAEDIKTLILTESEFMETANDDIINQIIGKE